MNAAFLLVTTAWLAGADAPVAKPAPAPAPAVAPAACGASCGSCCNDCGSCCEDKPGLFARLCARFKKNDCCDSCCAPTPCCKPTTCCAPAPVCKPACCPAPTCNDCCEKEGFFKRLCGKFKKNDCCDSCAPTCCAPAPVCKPVCPAPCVTSCNSCCDSCCEKEGFFKKLRGKFRKHDCCDSCDSCNSCGGCVGGACGAPGAPMKAPEQIPAPKEPAKKMPNEEPMKPVSAIEPAPKATLTVETETKNPFELSRRYESRVAHAADYSSLTGQLFFVHADGGLWVLRYAPLWQEDPNGGSMVLARGTSMDNYHEGDLVTVHGNILSQRSSVFLGGPLYRVSSISLVDRETK